MDNSTQYMVMCVELSTVNAAAAIDELGDVYTFAEARAAGVPERQIYELRDSGAVVSLGRGLYRRSDAPPANLDFIEIAERSAQATICLETALAYHGFLDAISNATDIAIPRGSHRPGLRAAVRLHTFQVDTFDIGRELVDVGARRPLGIYNAERSIIDYVRLRHVEGSDQAWEALRRWLVGPGNKAGQLLRLAKQFPRAEPALRAALEVLL